MADSTAVHSAGRGVLYVATGEKFVNEAVASALSCKAQMPDVPIHLFSDVAPKPGVFDSVSLLEKVVHRSGDKILPLTQSPFEKTVFLDTDTFACAPFYELFDLLDRFELAAAHSPKRIAYRDKNIRLPEEQRRIPLAFPELNTGVLAYRKHPMVDELFRQWHFWYTYTVKRGDNDHKPHDQPAFRAALFESQCRYYVLTPEYNFRFNIPSAVCGQVKILHGRTERINELAGVINSDEFPRVYIHGQLLLRTPSGVKPAGGSPKLLVMHVPPPPERRRKPLVTRFDARRPFLSAAAWRVRKRARHRIVSGPFTGVSFHKPITGMCYYPKLLGTYEMELHPVIEELCAVGFERIVNAGAGDGYFTIGLASRIQRASVVAFEARDNRRDLIRQLAERNRAGARVRVEGQCDAAALGESLNSTEPPLLFMDVEGAEEELLDPSLVPQLRSAFIVVEIHETARPGIGSRLAARFADTHAISAVSMRGRKPADFPLKNSAGQPRFRPSICMSLLNENRANPVGWLYLRPDQAPTPA